MVVGVRPDGTAPSYLPCQDSILLLNHGRINFITTLVWVRWYCWEVPTHSDNHGCDSFVTKHLGIFSFPEIPPERFAISAVLPVS